MSSTRIKDGGDCSLLLDVDSSSADTSDANDVPYFVGSSVRNVSAQDEVVEGEGGNMVVIEFDCNFLNISLSSKSTTVHGRSGIVVELIGGSMTVSGLWNVNVVVADCGMLLLVKDLLVVVVVVAVMFVMPPKLNNDDNCHSA
jgi:hypothetical protein